MRHKNAGETCKPRQMSVCRTRLKDETLIKPPGDKAHTCGATAKGRMKGAVIWGKQNQGSFIF